MIGIPKVLLSMSKICERGYQFFIKAGLRAPLSTHNHSLAVFIIANMSCSAAGVGKLYFSQLEV